MIPITKAEKDLLVKAFPPYKPPFYRFPRTMKQDSKRHHYFCTESEELMRAIASSNSRAAQLVEEFDRQRKLREERKRLWDGGTNGSSRTAGGIL